MSGTWNTIVYFPRHAKFTTEFLQPIVDGIMATGCEFLVQSDRQQLGVCWSLGIGEYHQFATLDMALDWITNQQGGVIEFWDVSEDLVFLLVLNPCGHDPFMLEGVCDIAYGNIGLSIDSTYLKGETNNVIVRRFKRIYTWSHILASSTRPLYGWGDLDYYGNIEGHIPPERIAAWTIPRISWWNYFSVIYLSHVGREFLNTSAAWLNFEDKDGRTVILRPPGEPEHIELKELIDLGFDNME